MAQSINIEEDKQKRDSLTISLILHLFLFLILLIPIVNAFNSKPEPPQFQGIQVALGYPEANEKTKTKPSASAAAAQPKSSKKTSKAKQSKKVSKPTAKKVVKSTPAPKKRIVSETLEKESPIVATKKKVIEDSKEVKEAKAAKAKAQAEAEEKALAKAQAKAEAEEAKRQAEEEAKRKAAKKAAAKAAAKSKFNSLMNNADGNGAPSKGDPKGTPNADALDGITKGKGKAGNGLGDRGLLHAPDISDNTQKTGKVVVNICVNKNGNVISASYTQKGSTTTDSHLIKLATESARKYKFAKSTISEQCGDITIDFKLK